MAKVLNTKCLTCKSITNQKVIFSKVELPDNNDEDEDGADNPYEITNEYMIIQCAGCNTISFLERMSIQDTQNMTTLPDVIDTNYPEKGIHIYNFLSEEEQESLPKILRKLYDEVKVAFENDAEILSGLGLRTLTEAICIEQKVTGNNLQTKIVSLKDQGLISVNEVPILDKLRVIGNFAAHEIKGLPLDILSYALDIINHVLKSIYILPKINKKINVGKF